MKSGASNMPFIHLLIFHPQFYTLMRSIEKIATLFFQFYVIYLTFTEIGDSPKTY